jgi:hypothetical protein
VIKNPKHLDKVLTAVLAKKCTGTGNVYRWAQPGAGHKVLAEFTDGDVTILVPYRITSPDEIVRQLLVAHGEIKVPGQL